MADSTRWGITVPLAGVPLQEHRAIFGRLERYGYTDVWTSEGVDYDGFTPLALAAACSTSLRLGVGVASAFTRGPALLAQTAATMAELSPAGFVLGIGSSSDVIVHDWNGIPFERPYSRTRDIVRFRRAAFTGERVTADFHTFSVRNFRLAREVTSPPTIVVAALRERMLQLAGREADGASINFTSVEDTARMAAMVREENADA